MKRFGLSVLLLLAACRRDNEENLGLGRPVVAPPELDRLDRPGRLEALLALPDATVAAKLGPHRRKQSVHLAIERGARSEVLDEHWLTELDGRGNLHALHDTSRDESVEWYLINGWLFVRVGAVGQGRFVKRRPQSDEVDRLRDEQSGVLGGYFAVLGRFAARTATPAESSGRAAVVVDLHANDDPAAFSDDDPAHAWRASLAVSTLGGSVTIDRASQAVTAARLQAGYRFSRGGQGADVKTTVALDYQSETAVGPIPALVEPDGLRRDEEPAWPAKVVGRPRPLVDRAALLEGLVSGRR